MLNIFFKLRRRVLPPKWQKQRGRTFVKTMTQVNVIYRSNKDSELFPTKSKVKTATLDAPNVVYKMQYSGPKCHYISQTERQLQSRLRFCAI